MTTEQAVNRGYNLMMVALLLFPGFAFFMGGLQENDVIDKVDDIGIFASGLVLTGWYLIGQHRMQRSALPIALTVVSLVIQIAGVFFERNDNEALGNDIGGMFILVPVLVFAIFQFTRSRAQAPAEVVRV